MTQYVAIFDEHMKKYFELANQRTRIQAEMENVLEMLKATFGMMADEEKSQFLDAFQTVLDQAVKNEVGLTEAIRKILESNPGVWFNAVKVRDGLIASGFDFSAYHTNPLTSVHTVLKRFKRTEVKMKKSVSGIKALREYRWIKPASPKPTFDYPGINPNVFAKRLAEAETSAYPPVFVRRQEKEKK